MRRKAWNTAKELIMGFVLGAILMASFLFFGMRARAAEIDRSELASIPRQEMADLRAREDYIPPVRVSYSQSDLDLLAALVWAEAGDQDFVGQWIVADCVCNRASERHPEWPSTIEAVIYQSGQFSVVANGRLAQGFSCATAENYEAARRALSGDHYDTNVIYFSMYYCANGTFAYQHGDHFIGY